MFLRASDMIAVGWVPNQDLDAVPVKTKQPRVLASGDADRPGEGSVRIARERDNFKVDEGAAAEGGRGGGGGGGGRGQRGGAGGGGGGGGGGSAGARALGGRSGAADDDDEDKRPRDLSLSLVHVKEMSDFKAER